MKIRGTAHHIGEKYLQLARDAQSSGDPVMAESYLQHAEHYFRLIATAQQAQQQAAHGYQRPPGEPDQDEDGDEDFDSLPDRFASPPERLPQQNNQNQPPPYPQDRQPYQNGGNNGGGQQPYEARQNFDRQNQPQPSFPQGDRQPQQQDRPYNQDRNQDRTYDNRNTRNEGGRSEGGRSDRGDRNDRGDRSQQGGNPQDRGQGGYQGNGQHQGDRPPRDYDNRNFRNNRGPRDFRDAPQPREQRQPQVDEAVAGGLPAFITGPMRNNVPESTSEQPPVEAEAHLNGAVETADESQHMRPRRRRRPKGEFATAGEGGESRPEPQDATDSTGD